MKVRKIARTIPWEKKRVAAYCRVSTGKETQEESFDIQLRTYQKMITANPEWEFAGIYADPGRTGTSVKRRAGFQQMIMDAEAGKMDVLLVKSISRFARNVIDSQRYVRLLKECGVSVRFEKENISTADPASEFVFSLLSAVAQDESHSISENVKWAYHKNFENGKYRLGNNRILGYDTDRDGKLIPNQDAWIVQEVFRRFLAGESYRQIAEGVTAMGAKCLRTDNAFSPETIRYMVVNETYVGDKLLQKRAPVDYLTKQPDPNAEYSPRYLRDDHIGIIDRDTWEKAQGILEQRRAEVEAGVQKKGKEHHFLYGKVYCGECGTPFTRRTLRSGIKNGSAVNYKAWNCRERQKGKRGNGCKNALVKEEELLKKISRELGWEWNGAEQFDQGRFVREIKRVNLFADRIEIEAYERGRLKNQSDD